MLYCSSFAEAPYFLTASLKPTAFGFSKRSATWRSWTCSNGPITWMVCPLYSTVTTAFLVSFTSVCVGAFPLPNFPVEGS